jgi:Novel STAND NTPase 1
MPAISPSEPVKSSGIHIGDVGGSVNFSALGDIAGGDKITTITTTIQISVEAITQRPLVTISPYRGWIALKIATKTSSLVDQLIKSLLAQLGASNVLLVLGASGSGKSSVVRAGLLPALSQLIGARFRYFTFVPDVNPFESLRSALQGAGFSQAQTRDLLNAHPETPTKLIHTLQREGDQWLFFVDQFEEIFTVSDQMLRKTFIAGLVAIAQDTATSTKLVLAMRADFLDRFSPFPQFTKIIEKNIDFVADSIPTNCGSPLSSPQRDTASSSSRGSSRKSSRTCKVRRVRCRCCNTRSIFSGKKSAARAALKTGISTRKLTAISVASAAPCKSARIKSTRRLATAPARNPLARSRRSFARFSCASSISPAKAPATRLGARSAVPTAPEQEILRALVNQKLLVSNRERGDATIEVAREALFASWGRLKNWIEAGKQVIFAKNRLADDARRWQRRQHEDASGAQEELLGGTRLAQGLDMRARGDFLTRRLVENRNAIPRRQRRLAPSASAGGTGSTAARAGPSSSFGGRREETCR